MFPGRQPNAHFQDFNQQSLFWPSDYEMEYELDALNLLAPCTGLETLKIESDL